MSHQYYPMVAVRFCLKGKDVRLSARFKILTRYADEMRHQCNDPIVAVRCVAAALLGLLRDLRLFIGGIAKQIKCNYSCFLIVLYNG